MPGIDRRARDIGRPVPPGIERRCRGAGDAGIAPQRQHRDRDLLACVAIGLVDLEIGIGAGAIILAHRVHARGIAERREIMLQRARIDGVEIFRLGLARHLLLAGRNPDCRRSAFPAADTAAPGTSSDRSSAHRAGSSAPSNHRSAGYRAPPASTAGRDDRARADRTTRPPRSWPASAKCTWPSCSIASIIVFAIARLV